MKNIKVVKRDGRETNFDIERIKNAIYKAFEDYVISYNEDETNEKINVNMDRVKHLTKNVQIKINQIEKDKLTVEEIQDLVEKVLISHKETGVYKKFAFYRAQRTKIREANSDLMKEIFDITFKDAEEVDAKRDNANVDGNTSMGAMLQYGSAGSKQFAMRHVLKSEHADAHKNGTIHCHDSDFISIGTLTCCQIDIASLLKDGFSTGHGHLREPQDIMSYAALAAIAIQSNQNKNCSII